MGMDTKLNWGSLYEQGRCKAIGVPWTDEEIVAWKSGVPAKYVRLGILTLEAYEARKKNEKPDDLINKSKDELLMIAHKKDIPATIAADTETLIRLIENKGVDPQIAPESVVGSKKKPKWKGKK